MRENQIRSTFGDSGIRDYAEAHGRLGAITDDTQMTLFTAEGMLRGHVRMMLKGVCHLPGVVSHAYLRWIKTQGEKPHGGIDLGMDGWLITHRDLFNTRAPGATCISALKAMKRFGGRAANSSKGCGGVMRVAPVGMYFSLEGRDHKEGSWMIKEAFSTGTEVAALTHGHRTGQLTAGFLSAVVALILSGTSLVDAIEQAVRELRRQKDHRETYAAIERAQQFAIARPGRQYCVRELGEGWVAEEALAMSLYCALSAKDFESGIILAVNHGGDSDSTGAITGNLLGAMMGVEAIPDRWLQPLELSHVIREMADDMATFPQWDLGDYSESGEHDFYWERYPGW